MDLPRNFFSVEALALIRRQRADSSCGHVNMYNSVTSVEKKIINKFNIYSGVQGKRCFERRRLHTTRSEEVRCRRFYHSIIAFILPYPLRRRASRVAHNTIIIIIIVTDSAKCVPVFLCVCVSTPRASVWVRTCVYLCVCVFVWVERKLGRHTGFHVRMYVCRRIRFLRPPYYRRCRHPSRHCAFLLRFRHDGSIHSIFIYPPRLAAHEATKSSEPNVKYKLYYGTASVPQFVTDVLLLNNKL